MAACNASGARSYAYGPMRPHITGLHVALADGDLLELQRGEAFAQGRHLSLVTAVGRTLELDLPGYTMPKTKNASGYFVADEMDAIDLFIGACGTLGVITELEIALQAAPAVVWGVSCFFNSEDKAVSFTDSMRPVLSHAAAIEYFDAGALDILRRQREQSTALPRCRRSTKRPRSVSTWSSTAMTRPRRPRNCTTWMGARVCGWPRRCDMGRAHRG